MKKLFPIPGWMFGMNISFADVNITENNRVECKYNRTIGWMAKNTIESKFFDSIAEYMEYCDKYLTCLYSNAYLTKDERIFLNEIGANGSGIAFRCAKEKFENKTAINFLHEKITLKML